MGHWQLRFFLFIFGMLQGLVSLHASNDSLSLASPWQSRTLENGLQIVVRQDTTLPLSVVNISIRAGSVYESQKMSGWTALIAGLMTSGNRLFPGKDSFQKTLFQESILHDHFITPRSVSFRFQGLSPKTEQMIAMLAAATQTPTWGELEINHLKSRMLIQAEEEMKDPLYYLRQTLEQKVWGTEAHRRNPAGGALGIVRADSAGLYAFRKPFWVPYRCVLMISGPLDPETVFAFVYKYWGRWQDAASDPDIQFPIPEWPEIPGTNLFVMHQQETKLPVFMAEWKIPENAAPYAEYITELLNLPNGHFKRSFPDTLAVLDLHFQQSNGALYCSLVPNPKSYLKNGTDSLMLQIRRMRELGFFSPTEIETVSRSLYRRHLKSTERIPDFMSQSTRLWAGDAVIQASHVDLEKIQKATIQIFMQAPMVAGYISNPTLSEITGLRDFFYSMPDTSQLAFSLEQDTLIPTMELDTFLEKSMYFLNWSAGLQMTYHISIPSRGMNESEWEVQKSKVMMLIRQAWLKNSEYVPERNTDISFKYIQDTEAYLPERMPELDIPTSETPDVYQFYIIPEYVLFNRPTF